MTVDHRVAIGGAQGLGGDENFPEGVRAEFNHFSPISTGQDAGGFVPAELFQRQHHLIVQEGTAGACRRRFGDHP